MSLGLKVTRETLYPVQSREVVQLFDLSQFLAGFPIQNFKRNEMIYDAEDSSDTLFFIKEGTVITGIHNEYREDVITSLLFADQLFGEQGLMGKKIRGTFAKAKGNTKVIIVPLYELRKMMIENGSCAIAINQLILKKLQVCHEKWRTQIVDNARTRLVGFILHVVEKNGRRVGLEWTVDNFFPHREIASMIGSSRQTVTVTLNLLRDEGIIYFNRKRLIIRDMDRLIIAGNSFNR